MATPIAYQKIQISSGLLKIPIYNPNDLTDTSNIRIQTPSGLGTYKLKTPDSSTPLRINTNLGIMGVDTTIESGIQRPPEGVANNLLSHSEDFTQSAWVKGANVIITDFNQLTFPDTTDTYMQQPMSLESGKTYTLTVWAYTPSANYNNFTIKIGGSTTATHTPTDNITAYTVTKIVDTTWTYDIQIDNGSQGEIDLICFFQLEEGSGSGVYSKTT